MPRSNIDKPDELIVPVKIGDRIVPVLFMRSGMNTWTNVAAVTFTYDEMFGEGRHPYLELKNGEAVDE